MSTLSRKKTFLFFILKSRYNGLNSEKKANFNFEDRNSQNSQSRIYNSERKKMENYLEFHNESPSPTPNIEAKQILTSWIKNEQEAYKIKEKFVSNPDISKKDLNFFQEK